MEVRPDTCYKTLIICKTELLMLVISHAAECCFPKRKSQFVGASRVFANKETNH